MMNEPLDVDYHNRETIDMIMEKADSSLFYNFRHLKNFKAMTKNVGTIWSYRWPEGDEIEMFDKLSGKTLFKCGHNPHFAEYLCSLHNMSDRLIKEVESKYVG